ncbi:glycosyltransferase [Lactobacillus sp. 3B(2020)]|uniref:glycosyltransferase n=1 Tax=Lactobacillus sp. 3B(2020) TaxID=2695882 RepID=UPI0015E0243B|nr:glycosyltransferase [Lactobacillus sp. 3B(2020)]QLL70911.1 glycosyltransferase family 8 protein [Lactobacillus sp. 3B(2020)]
MRNIVFCGDDQMLQGLTIAIISLLQHSSEPLNIIVVTAQADPRYRPLTNRQLYPINDYLSNFGSHLKLVDLTKQVRQAYPIANQNSIFTVNCMLRLYLDLLPNLPERFLYLDTDIICRRDFTELYYQNLHGYDLAGVLDYYGKWFFHHHLTWHGFDYLNSGVLLFNTPQAKKDRLFSRCRQQCQNTTMFLPDQTSLNRFARKKYLNHRYNEQRRLHSNTVFQHFTTTFRLFPFIHPVTVKPWQLRQLHQILHIYEYDELIQTAQELLKSQKGSGRKAPQRSGWNKQDEG